MGAHTTTDIADFLEWCEVERGLSVHTLRAYERALERYEDTLRTRRTSARRAQRDDVSAYSRSLADYSTSTRRLHLAAVRSFHTWLQDDGRMGRNPARLVAVPKKASAPTAVHPIARIDAVAAAGTDRRLRLLVALLYGCGLRISEAAAVRVRDVDLDDWNVQVVGKGRKVRTVPIMRQVDREAIAAAVAEHVQGYLLPSPRADSKHGHLDQSTLHRMLVSAAEACGFERSDWHPHALRHSRAKHLRAMGRDVFFVQRFLGHSSLEITADYVHADTMEATPPAAQLGADLLQQVRDLLDQHDRPAQHHACDTCQPLAPGLPIARVPTPLPGLR